MKIVHIIFLFGLILSSRHISYSQSFSLGLVNGTSFTTTSPSFFSDATLNYGYTGGFELKRENKNHLVLLTGVLYEKKGFRSLFLMGDSAGNVDFQDNKSSFNFNYLSIPLSIGYRFGNGKFFGEINLGVSLSRLLKAKERYNFVPVKFINDVTEKVKSFDISPKINLSQGYKFDDKINLIFLAEYQHGLISFSNNKDYYFGKIRQKGFYIRISLQKTISCKNRRTT